jgi:raffinose/stachyose/melibiose transport system permease protein
MTEADSHNETAPIKRPVRWHIGVFLLPAFIVYSAIMVLPLVETLRQSFYNLVDGTPAFVGLSNYRVLFGDPRWAHDFWNALVNNLIFFAIHMCVQNPIGVALAALLSTPKLRFVAFYRTAIFLPTLLSFVIVGFIWKLILSPIWGVAPWLMSLIGAKSLFAPWLGQSGPALIAVSLISNWQYIGIPMMLIYAALINIPDDLLDAATVDGAGPLSVFWFVRLPLILPTLGVVSILTFVANFNAFDLIYAVKGALAGPNFSTDILGTFFYRTFFGYQLQVGSPTMGAAVATAMLVIILIGVLIYLFGVQRRLQRHTF